MKMNNNIIRLSENFTLGEHTKSMTAIRHGLDNDITPEHLENAKLLFQHVVQPVRNEFGPTIITSGYRGKKLNELVGGSEKSQHCNGQAADFECLRADNLTVARWIRDNLDFDQLISEFYVPGDPFSGWVHSSYVSPEKNRKECLTATMVNGKVAYSPGLPEFNA